MKVMVTFIIIFSLFLGAQETGEEVKSQEKTEEEPQVQLPAGEFVYRPEGRRDPFWNLLSAKSERRERKAAEGLAGLMIDEVDLEGIIFSKGEYKALFKGPDTRPWIGKVGDKLFDGEILSIDRYTVRFKKELSVALVGKKERIVTKSVNPEKEGPQ